MKDSTVIVLVIGGLAVLFFAVSKGFIASGAIPVGRTGIVAPQPAQNYSGYLAASTAPGVSNALNGLLSGLGSGLSSWLSPKKTLPVPAVQAAAPQGPAQPLSTGIGPSNPYGISDANNSALWADPLAYDNTNQLDFGYDPLALDNAYDPNYSLMTTDGGAQLA